MAGVWTTFGPVFRGSLPPGGLLRNLATPPGGLSCFRARARIMYIKLSIELTARTRAIRVLPITWVM